MQITYIKEIADKDIANLLDEASRGSKYWCEGVQKLAFESTVNGVIAGNTILTFKDTENKNKKHFFDVQNIKAGLKIMADKQPAHFADFVTNNSDDTTGDVFLQCALLGDIMYS